MFSLIKIDFRSVESPRSPAKAGEAVGLSECEEGEEYFEWGSVSAQDRSGKMALWSWRRGHDEAHMPIFKDRQGHRIV